ncbi:LysR family transcriptional regulator [Amphritea sp.]|uniref:LysR family transcriptional regulator n=1 Tax=Amphritea sp. TaxID=1872502 RepID=UPI0025BD7DD6|nr:LysR family transcriptional regulator [Amphritea sp.]
MMITPEQAFINVVEAGSFKKAAENLDIEPSSISRKVAALEERLNIKLLFRSTSRTEPTEQGRTYYEGLRRIVDEQMLLEEEMTRGATTMKGRLRIGSTVDLGEKFITPVITEMQKQAPEISFELLLGSEFVNLTEMHLDVAIRIGSMPDSSLIAKHLGDIPRVLVASPDYLKSYGVPNTPGDLADHHFVMYTPAQAKSDIEFADGARFPMAAINCKVCVNSLRAIRSLVREDAGIHWGPLWLYQDDLDRGILCEVLPSFPVKHFSVYAVYPRRAFLPQKTQLFIQQLSEKIQETC